MLGICDFFFWRTRPSPEPPFFASRCVEGAPEPLAASNLIAPIAPAPSSSAFPATTAAAKPSASSTKAMLKDAGAISLKPGKADVTLADAAAIARILETTADTDEAALQAAASVLEGKSQAHVAAVVAQLRAAAAIETVMEASMPAGGAGEVSAVDEAALFGAAKAAAAEALLE